MRAARNKPEEMIKWKWDASGFECKCPACGNWYDVGTTIPAEGSPCKSCVFRLRFALTEQESSNV